MKQSEVLRSTVDVTAVVASGAVAGLMFGLGLAAYSDKELPEAAWILQQQAKNKVFGRTMPAVSVLMTASLVGAAAVSRRGARRWFAAGALLAIGSELLTRGKEVPLNQQISRWDAEAGPRDWEEVRDQWFFNHIVRSVPAILSFGCAAVGLSRGSEG